MDAESITLVLNAWILAFRKLFEDIGLDRVIRRRLRKALVFKAEGVSAKAKAEAEATRLKGEADGAAEKAHGEGVAAGIKAQTEAYNGMENAYLLANRYIDVMPEVAEAVAKPLTAVDSIKMYGDGNATKLVRDTTGMVDQVTSGLKDATGIDLTELLSSFHQPFQPREDNE